MARSSMFKTSNFQAFFKKTPKQVGFSLIEVMVTLVILSFGLLGVSGLLVKGISNASASESMAKANLLVAGMADRIRVNSAVKMDYVRNYDDSIPSPSNVIISQNDLHGWLTSLEDQLPQGDGAITMDGSTLIIGVRWSNCLGTLSESDQKRCKEKPASAFKSIAYELRL